MGQKHCKKVLSTEESTSMIAFLPTKTNTTSATTSTTFSESISIQDSETINVLKYLPFTVQSVLQFFNNHSVPIVLL